MSGIQKGQDCTFVYNSSERISGLFHSPIFPDITLKIWFVTITFTQPAMKESYYILPTSMSRESERK